ncbi:L-galactose dehydrogenase-like isoform X2 [Anoplophora glabripennis]|uniref:L-galactose dehydrogenase-like isoform X2 n=1 Tax=Anoplophora glabripennis TaxID=217634 RepID=UPI00087590ED|nr:L-galactose dehydrogenase-like isoform X2 [Anoplophora glabripennis]
MYVKKIHTFIFNYSRLKINMALPDTFIPGFHDENEVRKLKYNDLGKTGLKVSELSLGTGGFSYFYGDFDVDECKKTVHQAVKRGINLIDTAPWYGHGVSEEILGKCLEGIPRKAYYLATKVCRYEKDPKLMFDFSASKTKKSIDDSLKRLGLDYVDILQVHDIEFAPTVETILTETLPTVEEIVKSGKARFVGITGYPVSTLLECAEQSSVKIDTVLSYCRLTMIDNTLQSFIPKFKENNIGIINAAANSMGLLSNFGPPQWHPASQHIKDVCTEAREYCKKNNVELGKLAVYHSLQQDGPDTVLVGMNSTKLLDYNLNVLLEGLSEKEKEMYHHVMKIFTTELKESHWENIELENYWKTIKGESGSSGFFK